MVRVNWNFSHPDGKSDLRWGPFPFRNDEGSINRPLWGEGIFMRDEFLAALDWRKHFYGVEDHPYSHMEFMEAREFIPGNDIRPFAFIKKLFDERTRIIKEFGEDDIRAKILKLIMNSIYGKMAQAIGGGFGEAPPTTANPWYAAAITAGTRAQMVRAALHNPENIILFATDAIYSTQPLHGLETYEDKRLGKWEYSQAKDVGEAAIFVMPGIYDIMEFKRGLNDKDEGLYYELQGRKDAGEKLNDDELAWMTDKLKETSKTRGFKSDSARELLNNKVRAAWRKGAETIKENDERYVTLGMAVASEDRHRFRGCWVDTMREMNIDSAGTKRRSPHKYKGRADVLVMTEPADNECEGFSRKYEPEWLDPDYGGEKEEVNEQREIAVGYCGADDE